MNGQRQYELVYVVSPQASEQDVTDLHAQIEGTIARFNATLARTENWGRRKLAYEIARHREGVYVVETITGSGEAMKEIDRRLRVTDAIIRHLIVRVDEDLRVAERKRTERKTTQARRRVARGLPPEPQPDGRRQDHEDDDDRMEAEVQR